MEQDFNKKHWSNPCPKYDCRNNACKCGLKYVSIPAALGDDSAGSEVAPKNGAYCNAVVKYEANGNIYMYSKEGIPVLLNSSTCDCPEEEAINLSVVFDDSSWGHPWQNYQVAVGYEVNAIIGTASLTPAQGNQGLFVNDDTGEFVTIKQAYELIESGNKVRFNHVPVGQSLLEPHSSSQYGDCFDGVILDAKYTADIDGAPLTAYSGTVFKLGENLPPLGVYIQKIDQEDPEEDTYEFFIQGRLYEIT